VITTEDRVKKALTYLAETDEEHAHAKALVKGLEQSRKTVKSIAFLQATGTMAEKEAVAYKSQEYQAVVAKYENAVADEAILHNKRTTNALIVDVWRSENANRRTGNI
jgi:hypothetical protein